MLLATANGKLLKLNERYLIKSHLDDLNLTLTGKCFILLFWIWKLFKNILLFELTKKKTCKIIKKGPKICKENIKSVNILSGDMSSGYIWPHISQKKIKFSTMALLSFWHAVFGYQ